MSTEPATLSAWLAVELDRKLASEPDDYARYRLLARQSNVWRLRRKRFIETDGMSESYSVHPTFGRMTATDFVIVIGMIDGAKTKLERTADAARILQPASGSN